MGSNGSGNGEARLSGVVVSTCGQCYHARNRQFLLEAKKAVYQCFGAPPIGVVGNQAGRPIAIAIDPPLRVPVFEDTSACGLFRFNGVVALCSTPEERHQGVVGGTAESDLHWK